MEAFSAGLDASLGGAESGGGGVHDASAFPWERWLCSGAVLYLAFSCYVVPVWILTTTWGQVWGGVGLLVCGACAPFAGGWDQRLQSRQSLLCPCCESSDEQGDDATPPTTAKA